MNNEDFKKGFMIVNGSKIEPLPKDLFDVPSKEREEEIIKYMSNKIVEDWVAKYGNNPEVDKIINERIEYMANIKTTIMNYTKADLRKFFLAGRRFGLLENEDNTPMNFNEFFEVYSQIQDDTTYDQRDHLTEMMEISQKAGLYKDPTTHEDGICLTKGTTTTDFLGRPADQIFTEVDIIDAIYYSKICCLKSHEIIEKLKDRKWPK